MSPNDIVELIDAGLQSSSEDAGVETLDPAMCARCQIVPPVQDRDLCSGCRAFLLGDSDTDPAGDRFTGLWAGTDPDDVRVTGFWVAFDVATDWTANMLVVTVGGTAAGEIRGSEAMAALNAIADFQVRQIAELCAPVEPHGEFLTFIEGLANGGGGASPA